MKTGFNRGSDEARSSSSSRDPSREPSTTTTSSVVAGSAKTLSTTVGRFPRRLYVATMTETLGSASTVAPSVDTRVSYPRPCCPDVGAPAPTDGARPSSTEGHHTSDERDAGPGDWKSQ